MNRMIAGFLVLFAILSVGCGDQASYDDPQAAKRAAARQLIEAATKEAGLISKAEDKADAYLSLAEVQVAVGDTAAARQNVETATTTVAGITGDTSSVLSPLAGLYIRLVRVQADVGDVDAAKSTVTKISDGWGKAMVYAKIAQAQIKQNDLAGARQTLALAKNETDGNKSSYYMSLGAICNDITDAWVETGDIAGAKAFVENMPDDPLGKAHSYRSIAVAQAKSGNAAEAYQTVESAKSVIAGAGDVLSSVFPNLCIRDTYIAIAENQAKAGDAAGAKYTLARLRETVEKESADLPKVFALLAKDSLYMAREMVFLVFASTQAKAGNLGEARGNIQAAKAAVAEINDSHTKALGCIAISELQVEIGDLAAARESFEAAKAAAANIDTKTGNEDRNHVHKIWAYCSIMTAQAKAGDDAGARETLETMRMLIPKFSPKYSVYKSWAYRLIAEAQTATGDITEAKVSATQIQSESDKDRAYRSIVAAQAEACDVVGAIEYCTQVLKEPIERCKCLSDAAMRLCSEP